MREAWLFFLCWILSQQLYAVQSWLISSYLICVEALTASLQCSSLLMLSIQLYQITNISEKSLFLSCKIFDWFCIICSCDYLFQKIISLWNFSHICCDINLTNNIRLQMISNLSTISNLLKISIQQTISNCKWYQSCQ